MNATTKDTTHQDSSSTSYRTSICLSVSLNPIFSSISFGSLTRVLQDIFAPILMPSFL